VADDPTQVELLIRFGLNSLGERNAHHDFEHICLGLARRRITSNLRLKRSAVSRMGNMGVSDKPTAATGRPLLSFRGCNRARQTAPICAHPPNKNFPCSLPLH
jgi:hypothetical protein